MNLRLGTYDVEERVEDNRNKKVTGSAQRPERIQEDYIRSQGPKLCKEEMKSV